MKQKSLIFITFVAAMLTACGSSQNNFNFKSAKEAVNACHSELSKLRKIEGADNEKLADITANWLCLQDSVISVYMRDSSVVNNKALTEEYIAVADSVKTEITRIATSRERKISDITEVRFIVAEKTKNYDSKLYQDATDYFQKLDENKIYLTYADCIREYEKLLSSKKLSTEKDLLDFIAEEDRCFRSLMSFLKDAQQEKMEELTKNTSAIFDNLYKAALNDQKSFLNKKILLYLNMRINRRVIQNAEVCYDDVHKNLRLLSPEKKLQYRWMIIQPLLTINNEGMMLLDKNQKKFLTKLSDELVQLLLALDDNYNRKDKEKIAQIDDEMNKFYMNIWLQTTL